MIEKSNVTYSSALLRGNKVIGYTLPKYKSFRNSNGSLPTKKPTRCVSILFLKKCFFPLLHPEDAISLCEMLEKLLICFDKAWNKIY